MASTENKKIETQTETLGGISREEDSAKRVKVMAEEIAADAHFGFGPTGPTGVEGLPGSDDPMVAINALFSRVVRLEAGLETLSEVTRPAPAPVGESITATMVGGTFNCPECGLRITSPALIKTQGLKAGGYYEHPFDESPRLNGGKCRLIGKKFESPSIVLKMIQPKPAPKVDVAETIGV